MTFQRSIVVTALFAVSVAANAQWKLKYAPGIPPPDPVTRTGTTRWNPSDATNPGMADWGSSYYNMGFLAVGGSGKPLTGNPWASATGKFSATYFFDSPAL